MQTCPDCSKVKQLFKDDSRVQIIDIGEHVRNLKQFLVFRDNNPAFDAIRKNGSVGIPCFVLEDGNIKFSIEEAGLQALVPQHAVAENEEEGGSFCSIDGKGC